MEGCYYGGSRDGTEIQEGHSGCDEKARRQTRSLLSINVIIRLGEAEGWGDASSAFCQIPKLDSKDLILVFDDVIWWYTNY
jgi:hypothetical protein